MQQSDKRFRRFSKAITALLISVMLNIGAFSADAAGDSGPIVVQHVVPVKDGDTAESLSARILVEEHRAYPEALNLLLSQRWNIVGRRVVFS